MSSILVVCTGNLCRSPMAAALLQARLARDAARGDWGVGSAGVWAAEGNPASENAVLEMGRRGINLLRHRSRPVTADLVAAADLVLVMTQNHAEALRAAFAAHVHKVHLLTAMAGQEYDVRDPYGGTREEYAGTAAELEQLIEDGYDRIVALVEEAGG